MPAEGKAEGTALEGHGRRAAERGLLMSASCGVGDHRKFRNCQIFFSPSVSHLSSSTAIIVTVIVRNGRPLPSLYYGY
jgi:hypothetical protein